MKMNAMNITAMKTTFFLLCVLATTAAFGQAAGVISNQPVMLQLPEDSPQHAAQHEMGQEHSLLSDSAYTYAKGERPLSDFGGTPAPTVPLGDIARALRKGHAGAKRAQFVLEK